MPLNRRNFIKQTGTLITSTLALNQSELMANSFKTLGVQLYSVRDSLPKDPKGTMTKLAQIGYQQFESYAGPQGFLWGMKPKEIKSFLSDLGVKMISTHFDVNKDLSKSIEQGAEAGLIYMLCPYIGSQKSLDDWKKIAEKFNQIGEKVTKSGMKFGYHNHDYSFKPLEGQIPQEYLLANTDPNNVLFELDLCWIEVAGQDAEAHLKRFGKRYELCHIKDYSLENGKVVQHDLGKGSINFKKILHTAYTSGMKYFIVEQEEYPISPLISLKADADYMRKLTI